MIVTVKQNSYKRPIVKLAVAATLLSLFTVYYFHMSDKFEQEQKQEIDKLQQNQMIEKRALDIENIIFDEAQIAVDLITQEKVRTIKIVGKKLYIATDPDAKLEPLMVRYGVMALVKESPEDIKIAIDLNNIVESKYDGKNL